MKIAIPKERRPQEARVAASPETVKKLVALGQEVAVEKGAGVAAGHEEANASTAIVDRKRYQTVEGLPGR